MLNEKDSELLMCKAGLEDLHRKIKEKDEAIEEKGQDILVHVQNNEHLEETVQELSEVIDKFRAQNREDENTIFKLNDALLKIEAENERIRESEKKLQQNNEVLLAERNETIKNLQHTIETFTAAEMKPEENDDSLEEDFLNDGEKVQRLFKDLREKEQFIKKNNKRIMELQWKNRDLIDTIKEYEEKMLTHMETAEKLTVECENLNQQISQINNALQVAQGEKEEMKASLENKEQMLKQINETLKKLEQAEEEYRHQAEQDSEE